MRKADSKRVFLEFPHSLLTRLQMFGLPAGRFTSCRSVFLRRTKKSCWNGIYGKKIFQTKNFLLNLCIIKIY